MAQVLIIDDDIATCTLLQQIVENNDHTADSCLKITEGLSKIEDGEYDVVFLDVNMPDGNGLDALQLITGIQNPPEVIIITAQGNREGAAIAIQYGAWDYLQKPLSLQQITLSVKRVVEYRKQAGRSLYNRTLLNRENIIGRSPALNDSLELLAQAANNESNVLLLGETGTGKEVFARTLHDNSSRCKADFVVVDCTALPDNLVESILFGHERGAFTNAHSSATGLIKLADGGTLFLDEVGDLELGLQKKLLRVLQEKRFRPLGSKKEWSSDFRLVSATNQNLGNKISEGLFREDLFYRLRNQTINLPPLRQRDGDIELLMIFFLKKICSRNRQSLKSYSPDFAGILKQYSWPGNIREFLHVLESAIHSAGDEPILYPKHLPRELRIKNIQAGLEASDVSHMYRENRELNADLPLLSIVRDEAVSEAEHDYLQVLMTKTNWNIARACKVAGVGRTRLYDLLKKYAITRESHL